MKQFLRVKRGPKPPPSPPLPHDAWRETIFVEADGTEMIVVFSGKHMPSVRISRESHGRWRTVGHPVVKGS